MSPFVRARPMLQTRGASLHTWLDGSSAASVLSAAHPHSCTSAVARCARSTATIASMPPASAIATSFDTRRHAREGGGGYGCDHTRP